jgi:hypothetical protein
MAGIGAIGGGVSPFVTVPPIRSTEPSGDGTAGALGTKSGLGESKSAISTSPREQSESGGALGGTQRLSEDDQKIVQELKARDSEVRQHEQAHVAAAGRYANGGPQYEFTTGPDGRQYATGGHVSIDVSPASTPEATIQKAQVVRRAALAPAQPSGQDRAVAAQASQLESDARREIREAQQTETQGGEGEEVIDGTGGIQVPPPIASRDFSEYVPQSGANGVGSVGRLDISV